MGETERNAGRPTAVSVVGSSRVSTTHAGQLTRRPEGSGQTITPQFLLHALARWWAWLIPSAILAAGLAAGAVYAFFRPSYLASAWLQIQQIAPYIAYQPQDVVPDKKAFVATQIELLHSPMVLLPVISDPEIAKIPEFQKHQGDDLMAWLAKQIKVAQVQESELFTISYASPDPKNAGRVVNAVVESYLAMRGQEEAERVQKVLTLLEQIRAERTQEDKRLQEEVRQLFKEVTGKQVLTTSRELDSPRDNFLDRLRTQLANTELDRATLEADVKAYEDLMSKSKPEVSQVALQKALDEDAGFKAMQAAVDAGLRELAATQSVLAQAKANNYTRRLQEQIARDKQALENYKKEAAERLRQQLTSLAGDGQHAELEAMRKKLASIQETERHLRDRYQGEFKEAEKLGGKAAELEFRRADLDFSKQAISQITNRITMLRTEQQAPGRIMLRMAASPPPAPIEWVPIRQMAVAAVLGLLLPFGLVILWESTVRRVHGPQMLEQESHLAVMGEIARLPSRAKNARETLPRRIRQDLKLFEESVDSLRTNLLLSNELRGMRVLAVTSAAKHEGKTSVSVQLAVSIARSTGERTLIIDGDMRSPDVHNVFDMPGSPGLADVLDGRATFEEAVVTTWSDSLHVLPAGKLRSSPHKLVGNGALKSVVENAVKQYHYVIIDTPPVLAASEALVLAKVADACLICAMRDLSRGEQVRRACQRLAACGARLAGTILNGVPARTYAYHYGSYAET